VIFEFFIIIFICTLQSIFGVGVLLFGTPIFLLLDYEFIQILEILLPISLLINIFQITGKFEYVDRNLIIRSSLISLPIIFLILYTLVEIEIDVSIIVGFLLLAVSAKNISEKIDLLVSKFTELNFLPYILMGIIHGTSNLGGAILTILAHSKCVTKNSKRATIAFLYSLFALIQICSLYFALGSFHINIFNLTLGASTYLIVNKYIFLNINEKIFNKVFSIFLCTFGLMLVLKQW